MAVALLALVLALGPEGASAFALFPEPPGTGSPADLLALAARWSSVTGLDDGLQVGVAPGVASALQVSGDELASVEQAIVRGIQAWESPVLGFDITLEAAGTVEGPDSGFEIDVFAVPDSHPVFVANPQAFGGLVIPSLSFFDDRPLTNGRASAGLGITGADVYFNIDNFQLLAPFGPARLDILTRITIHEFGHTLGLGHPNESQNFDTNTDPFDSITIDPGDPFAGIIFSSNIDSTTIMSNEPCGPNPTGACPAVFFTRLGNDERGGRDVLYPVPEPTSGGLLGVGLLLIGGWRSLRRDPAGPPAAHALDLRALRLGVEAVVLSGDAAEPVAALLERVAGGEVGPREAEALRVAPRRPLPSPPRL